MPNNKFKLDLSTHDVMEGINGGSKSKLIKTVFDNKIKADGNASGVKINYREIPLEEITPRPINRFRQVGIERLAKSIKNTTLINPIIVAKPSHLPADSEVLKSFKDKGVDVSTLKYVIVSGERRYNAFLLLHEEETKDPTKSSLTDYKYGKISARILTKEEAQNEELIYTDSNIETRQLSSLEIMINCREMMQSVSTEEEKKQSLVDMGLDPETTKFNQVKYCKFYFEHELGILDVTESNISQTLATVQKCTPEVLDAIVDGALSMRKARELRDIPKDKQGELIALLREGKTAEYELLLEKLSSKREKSGVPERMTHRDAAKICQKYIAYSEKALKQFAVVLRNLSGEDEQVVRETIDEINELINRWNERYEKLK